MINEQILKKAIEKAFKNRYKNDCLIEHDGSIPWLERDETISDAGIACQIGLNLYKRIIFSHDFAKAFWGEERIREEEMASWTEKPMWQHCLQQMVLYSEPLKYLEKFLEEEKEKNHALASIRC